MTNIVITGCSTGIGLATAKYLNERFITVYPTARSMTDVEMLKDIGFEYAMQLDVTKPEQIKRVIASVLEKDNKIDTWFNNAGFGQVGAIEDLETQVLKEQFEINVFGLHECTYQIIPVMKTQGYGTIIQHSSVLGIVSLFGKGAYNASKYAIEGLTDTLRLELAGSNIHAVLLNTGPITSNFRKIAIKKLQKNIDIENSIFKERYIQNIKGTSKKVPFNKEADAVASVVYKIILSKNPQPRYYITTATYLLGYLKRILSTRILDKILIKLS